MIRLVILLRGKQISNAEIYDMYGPTETTVYSVFGKLNKRTEGINLSKLINNTQIYVLDKNKQLQPIGIPGELYISGDGLARGYINDLKRTKEVFLDHPFQKNKKIFKRDAFKSEWKAG